MPRVNIGIDPLEEYVPEGNIKKLLKLVLGSTPQERVENTFSPTPAITAKQNLKSLLGTALKETTNLQDKLYAQMAIEALPKSVRESLKDVRPTRFGEDLSSYALYNPTHKVIKINPDAEMLKSLHGELSHAPAGGINTYIHELAHHYWNELPTHTQFDWYAHIEPRDLEARIAKEVSPARANFLRGDKDEAFAEAMDAAFRGDVPYIKALEKESPQAFEFMKKIQNAMGMELSLKRKSLLGK